MPDTEGSFLMRWAGDVLFFSGDVKTTTIAIAITSSLCCSIVYWLVHVIGGPDERKFKPTGEPLRRTFSGGKGQTSSVRYHRQLLKNLSAASPCTKCSDKASDRNCSHAMCSVCCRGNNCSHHGNQSTTKNIEHDMDRQKQLPREVNLSYVGLDSWPERLGFVGAQLRRLNLAHNNLTTLPDELGCLRGLEELLLQCNNLSHIPVSVRNLTKLKDLDLSGNCLSSLPDALSSFTELIRLNAGYNALSCIPHTISHLHHLEELIFSSNVLKAVPNELCDLIKLKNLQLNMNQIKTLPDSIGQLIRLEVLDLSSCSIVSLPPSITKCRALVSLNLSNNVISQLPDLLGNLSNLEKLDISNNRLVTLPYSMVHLALNQLKVLGNHLQTLEEQSRTSSSKREFPTLGEISATAAATAPWRMVQELPYNLQEMLVHHTFCSNCGRRLFLQYESRIEFVFFSTVATDLPLRRVICSIGCKSDQS